MNWQEPPIERDEYDEPRFKGLLRLVNDKNEHLGSICWFDDDGPFYSSAMDPKDITMVRRIGPCTTLEGAKTRVLDAIEGYIPDLGKRAGYLRRDQ